MPNTDSVISEIAGDDCAKALVFISDPEDTPEAPEMLLQRLYGLTSAEARFALSLSAGNSLDGASNDCSITRETARTRLKRIFAKTDTHSQTELVRLILAGPGALGRSPEEEI